MKCTEIIYDVLSLWDPHPVPVRHLVEVAAMFGFTSNATRVGTRRLVMAEKVEPARAGGRAGYRLTARNARVNQYLRDACAREHPEGWDGAWLQVLLSVPEAARKSRSEIQTALKVLHMRSPYRGVWMRPNNLPGLNADAIMKRFAEADVDLEVLECRFPRAERGRELADQLWQSGTMATAFADAIDQLEQLIAGIDTMPIEEALVESFILGRDVVRLVFHDPLLPRELLPPEWPGDALRAAFARFSEASIAKWVAYARDQESYFGLDPEQFERVPRGDHALSPSLFGLRRQQASKLEDTAWN